LGTHLQSGLDGFSSDPQNDVADRELIGSEDGPVAGGGQLLGREAEVGGGGGDQGRVDALGFSLLFGGEARTSGPTWHDRPPAGGISGEHSSSRPHDEKTTDFRAAHPKTHNFGVDQIHDRPGLVAEMFDALRTVWPSYSFYLAVGGGEVTGFYAT
jgi:hypothetical protein